MEHSPNTEPANDLDPLLEENVVSTAPRTALRTTGVVLLISLLTAAAIVGITKLADTTDNDRTSANGKSEEASSSAIGSSAFLLRNGKFDCSTIYDQASLSQLMASGLGEIDGFNSFTDIPKPAPDGRVVCGSAVKTESASTTEPSEEQTSSSDVSNMSEPANTKPGADDSESTQLDVSYHLMSIPQACGQLVEGAQADQFGWVHNRKLADTEGNVVAIGSVLSNEQHGCLMVAGSPNEAEAAEGIDSAIAATARELAENIAPVLDKSLKAQGTAPATDGSVTPTFERDGHYDCRAYLDTTTMQQAQEIGLTRAILPSIVSENSDARQREAQQPTAQQATIRSDDVLAQCGVTKDSNEVEILTSTDPFNAICTAHTGVPLKSNPQWSYYLDERPANNPLFGRNQGAVSINMLHSDDDKGCIIVRSYGLGETVASPSEELAKLAPVATSISAIEELAE